MRVVVIGGGSWGTTLADLLAKNGHQSTLYVREQSLMAEMRSKRENSWYLPGITLHESLTVHHDLEQAVAGAEVFLFVVPTQFFRGVLRQLRELLPKKPKIVCANKGIEVGSLNTISEIVAEELA